MQNTHQLSDNRQWSSSRLLGKSPSRIYQFESITEDAIKMGHAISPEKTLTPVYTMY